MAHHFNPKQQEIFDRLKKFIKEDDYDTFILNGYAGTGKTFLIQEFASYLRTERYNFSLLATTGRAAAVLRGKTDFETKTIHGCLYSFSRVDGDHDDLTWESSADDFGQMRLVFSPNKKMDEKCLYIVDEASMLATESKDDTSSFATFGSGQLLADLLAGIGKNKIIFVGDTAQLPPVFQEISPALDKKYLDSLGRHTIKGTLNQIMRTKEDNDIIQMSAAVRKGIGKDRDVKWIRLPAHRYKNCTVVPDGNSLFLEYYARFLQYGPQKCIGISHSNKACNHLNVFFRKRLFPGKKRLLEVGEILMVTQNNYIVPLVNGDFIKIESLGEISHKCNLRFQNVRVLQLATNRSFNVKLALDPLAQLVSNLTTDQQRVLMIDFSKRMRKDGIQPKSEEYKEAMRKDVYLNSLRATYGYVVTCHKSQGGEWDDVFLFLASSMYRYMSKTYMRRWWYTAITRTKKQLYLHDEWWLS